MWVVYECDKIKRGQTPKNETLIEVGFETPTEAMERANELARLNRRQSYTVGWGGK